MRITDLANKLGFTNDQLIEILLEEGINKTDSLDYLLSDELNLIIDKYEDKNINKNNINYSCLKRFEIKGLFGRFNFDLAIENDINILVAENGSGKTTILNIMTSALSGEREDIDRLTKLPFESITITTKDGGEININKSDILNKSRNMQSIERILVELQGLVPSPIYRRLKILMHESGYVDLEEILELTNLYIDNPYERRHIHRLLIRDSEYNNIYGIDQEAITKQVKKYVKEPLIYFPTYRRVEEDLDNIIGLQADKLKYSIKKNNKINFGIKDVEIILNDLSTQLRDGAAEYYKRMTAEVLDDLICNKITINKKTKYRIVEKKLDIVIGRIGEEKIKHIDQLKKFIKGNLDVEYSEFLYYYIRKLIELYELQKAIDDKIIRFKDVCNKYLLNKEIKYDEASATVQVFDKYTNNKIQWNNLSSGEKQIISLFAKLYLNTAKPSIVVIDEPELSLSIFWQKTLLEDLYDSGKIALLIVTTHSPFIYKNRFNDFVKDLDLYKKEI